MRKLRLAAALCLTVLLCGCVMGAQPAAGPDQENLIVVGVSQVGAESEWRVANSESLKKTLSEENGYVLLFNDARQEQENQIRAVRRFIQQGVDYIVFSPKVETGWKAVLQEAKEAGIPVIMIDRDIETDARGLLTAYIGSDFHNEEGRLSYGSRNTWRSWDGRETVRIVHIQERSALRRRSGGLVPWRSDRKASQLGTGRTGMR